MKDAIASLLGEATMTKFTALMVIKQCENNTNPNASALRRNVRKYKNSLESHEGNLYDKLQPCIKAWAGMVSGFKRYSHRICSDRMCWLGVSTIL